jgi:hypothetical protein
MAQKKFTDPEGDSQSVQAFKSKARAVLQDVAATGDVSQYNWSQLKTLLGVSIKDALVSMSKKYPDYSTKPGESYTDYMADLIELFYLFENE